MVTFHYTMQQFTRLYINTKGGRRRTMLVECNDDESDSQTFGLGDFADKIAKNQVRAIAESQANLLLGRLDLIHSHADQDYMPLLWCNSVLVLQGDLIPILHEHWCRY